MKGQNAMSIFSATSMAARFEAINDTVLKFANSEQFKRSLRLNLNFMSASFEAAKDMTLDSAMKVLRPVSEATHILATAPVDENGVADIGDGVDTVESAVNAVYSRMTEEEKKNCPDEVKKKIPRKLIPTAKKVIFRFLAGAAVPILLHFIPNSQISELIAAQNQQSESQKAVIEILKEEIEANKQANALQAKANELIELSNEQSDELRRDFCEFVSDFQSIADELEIESGE